MLSIGFDIGTTTLSAVVMDAQTGAALEALTVQNDAAIPAEAWARLQDPDAIWERAAPIIRRLCTSHEDVRCVGLTGQMHGLVYVDEGGDAVSPLYTWQDGRGALLVPDGRSYADALSALTGKRIATGYGAATHYYNQLHGLVPARAAWAMTIQDYIGMRLTGRREPLMHLSNTHSFGAPDWPGIAPLIRATGETALIGETPCGVPVAVAIGDNQASFIGSVRSPADSVLVNIGTGGQISVATQRGEALDGVEVRPFVDGGSLLAYSSLCGGRAYALLERLFREIATAAGAPEGRLFAQMNALAAQPISDPLAISTLFSGTRGDPALRGSIHNISDANLTAAHLVQGVLRGMVDELVAPFPGMRAQMAAPPAHLIGSGNGIRQNSALRALFENAFGMGMRIPAHREEAAFGAALFALAACGARASVADAQSIIKYE